MSAAGLAVVVLCTAMLSANQSTASAATSNANETPIMGWSSWSSLREDPTAAAIEAQASALRSSGLEASGYTYVDVDDGWYECPGAQGPSVDGFGRWIPDPSSFPSSESAGGIATVANYVHSLGLKFGLYVTPGISKQAVTANTPIEGTIYRASDIAITQAASNYDCGGMLELNYSSPGAQAFVDSWADEFAQWGVDYLKLDGVGAGDISDARVWSTALAQSGRPIHLELSNSLDIADAATWRAYANGWRTGGDIECYGCDAAGSPYPLTDWINIQERFDEVAAWQPYGSPGGFNDYDSIEIGNGSDDGLTPDERQSQMSLWALGTSPLIIGADLTHLTQPDLSYLKNSAVISVDQDSVDGTRVADSGSEQIFEKPEPNGDVVVGMFNTGSQPLMATATAPVLNLPPGHQYELTNLWTGRSAESGDTIAADVDPHGVALYRIRALRGSSNLRADATLDITPIAADYAGEPIVVNEYFYNYGLTSVHCVDLKLFTPRGWRSKQITRNTFSIVRPDKEAEASFLVNAGSPTAYFEEGNATGTARSSTGQSRLKSAIDVQTMKVSEPVTIAAPITRALPDVLLGH